MKKQLAFILTAALLCAAPVPAFAQDAKEPQVLKVSFDQIEMIVKSHNPTVLANGKSLDSLSDNDAAGEQQQELAESRNSLQNVNQMLESAAAAVTALPDGTERQAISASLQGSMASIEALRSLLSTQSSQLDVSDDTIEVTGLEMDAAADQLVAAAQQLFVTFRLLDVQRTDLGQQLALADEAVGVRRAQVSLGLATADDLSSAQQDRDALQNASDDLVLQMKTVKDNFSALLGYLPGGDVDVGLNALQAPDAELIADMDYDRDYETALGANDTLKVQQKRKDIAEDNRDDDLDSTVDDYRAASFQYQAALSDFAASFRRLSDEVANRRQHVSAAQTAADGAARILANQTRKYGLGLISSFELKQAQRDADAKRNALAQANINLFSAVEQYRSALGGTLVPADSGETS